MTLKQYNWKDGPDFIQQHSVAKHRILQAYLAAYFQTLVSSPNREILKLTLVDGFAGGGFLLPRKWVWFARRIKPSYEGKVAEYADYRSRK